MSLTRAIAHNTLIQFIGKAVSVAMGVVVIAMMTRALGAEGFGHYTTVTAFLQIFGILVDMGLTLTTVQFLSEPNANTERVLGSMLSLRILTAVIVLGLAPIVALFFPYPSVVKTGILVYTISFLFISVNQILLGLFQRELKTYLITVAEVVGRVVLVAGIAGAVFFHLGLLGMLVVIVIASIAQSLFTMYFASRFARIRLVIDTELWKRFLVASWPIGASIAANLAYFKADTVILSVYHPAEVVGLYGAPYRVLEVLITLPYLFVGVVFPQLRSAWLSDQDRFRRMLQRSFDALALVICPLIAGTIVLATPLMTLVAGSDFTASGPLLQILILATGFIFIGTLFGHAIVAIEKQRAMVWGYATVAVVSVAAYFVFIPSYGAVAAAWLTALSEALVAILTAVVTLVVVRLSLSLAVFAKSALASILMVGALMLLPSWHVLALVVVGAGVYGLFVWLLGAVSTQDLTLALSYPSTLRGDSVEPSSGLYKERETL